MDHEALNIPVNTQGRCAFGISYQPLIISSGKSTHDMGLSNGVNDSPQSDQAAKHNAVDLNGVNGTTEFDADISKHAQKFTPIAICGMACRLPGGIDSPQGLWEFLVSGSDARSKVPLSRYNISAWYSDGKEPGSSITEYGYFLDDSNDLGALDTSVFTMPRGEVENLDPQQRILLEVTRECFEDACEPDWRCKDIGAFVGSFGNDAYDSSQKETQGQGQYSITGTHDFALSNRLSYEMDLRGPSMTIRTACSSSLVGLNEACAALTKGDCQSAVVAGTSIIMTPALTTAISEQGALSPDGSCKTFSSDADGYARAEGVVAVYVKTLDDAIRDGNPVRAVIAGTATNFDGKTQAISVPSPDAQERLIRHTYKVAGIPPSDIHKTGFFECHGTGTSVGDLIETTAVARVFNNSGGVHIGSVKPNLGHGEGASGLTAVLKAVLALEHQTIPPNIKSIPRSVKIPPQLTVLTEATPWPASRDERVSVNSFGIGGSNAHVILESSRLHEVVRPRAPAKPVRDMPQLLLYSAAHPESLKLLGEKYTSYLEKSADSLSLTDVAYTLARRREHLPFRSFSIATKYKPGVASQPTATIRRDHSVVMVFTGQGSQWPRMGHEMLRSNDVFRESIKMLGEHLRNLEVDAPDWNLEEELLKLPSKSRVQEPRFSQPLCAALQIALVDTLASFGVVPSAVVGHSSGEVAAAYASGGLTAKEAITVAYYRGMLASKQSRSGSMAAVGLGCDAARACLIPGVVLACDNSPSSVTISGDTERVNMMTANIRRELPDVPISVLKVDRAYHSHHMVELGAEYQELMTRSGVTGAEPVLPFFSSVFGDNLNTQGPGTFGLGPKYWQANLELPVLFRDAVSSILQSNIAEVRDPIFLEVGPHSGLSGPLRQIMLHHSNNSPYVPTLVRRENSVESFFSAVGKLWTLHVDINVAAVAPEGSSLGDLPRYPWNHSQRYWKESRVSRQWRFRTHKKHELLGVKVDESSELEPMWRNLLRLDNAPWIRDHRISDDITFPFAGYVCMAAEAVRQVTGIETGVELRRVTVSVALVLDETVPPEMITTMRRHRLTTGADSEWWEFSISSYNGHSWTKHCVGEVRGALHAVKPGQTIGQASTPHNVNEKRWYERVRRAGLQYGPYFTTMDDMRTSSTGPQGFCTTTTDNPWCNEVSRCQPHPIIIDTCFQAMGAAIHHGFTHEYRQLIPVYVDHLAFSRLAAPDLTIRASANSAGGEVIGEASVVANGATAMSVSGVRLTYFETENDVLDQSFPITARSEWVHHVDFVDASALVEPIDHDIEDVNKLDLLAQFAVILSRCAIEGLDELARCSRMDHYRTWLNNQVICSSNEINSDTVTAQMAELTASLVDTPAYPAAVAINKILENTSAITTGQKHGAEILEEDFVLEKLTSFLNRHDASKFFRALAHASPNLRILELGVGHREALQDQLSIFRHTNGQLLISEYVYSSPSPAALSLAKERFKGNFDVEFATLDIGQDPAEQGFKERRFDLIIANDALCATPDLGLGLEHARKLLGPEGRLIWQQPNMESTWVNYVLGTLPQWWCGTTDHLCEESRVDLNRWEAVARAAGFGGLDAVIPESPMPYQMCRTIVARPLPERLEPKVVSLLCGDTGDPHADQIEKVLASQGYRISCCTLDDVPTDTGNIIVFLDFEAPFFENIDKDKWDRFKKFLKQVSDFGAGILWLTKPSQIGSRDPRYAPVLGVARTARSEMAIDFATCEIDNIYSSQSAQAVARVFSRIAEREKHDITDFEYSIAEGVVRASRFFPFSVTDELEVDQNFHSEAILQLERPGKLDSLGWASHAATTPRDNEVEVEVHAVGLNFRDVLEAMGVIPLGSQHAGFGAEASGIVRRIGPSATKFRIGDRVIVTASVAFSSVIMAPETHCERMPDEMSFAEGASMTVVFMTAIHALVDIGRLEQGKSVLIHSGCGGVGLAAIQVARMLGAEIFTTVGSQDKVKFLSDNFAIPGNRIFNSRSTTFAHDILRETHGRGVDVALNSLSGELLHATWRCVAKWGTMIEIGKVDLLGAGKLDLSLFLGSRNFSSFDLRQMSAEQPQVVSRLLRSMMAYFEQGLVRPVHLAKVFPASSVQDAFRYMQQGRHLGKIVVSIRDSDGRLQVGDSAIKSRVEVELDPSASYILIGGLGGLGHSVAVWMVQRGARHLTFLSRSGGTSSQAQDFITMIESMGCSVQIVAGDVGEAGDVARTVNGVPHKLKGIIHMAMILRDESFMKMSIDDWSEATAPKIKGTWNLHNITQDKGIELDFFVLFSSLSGVLGQPGQANYAAANTFLDSFVQYRKTQGLACAALAIGAMEGVGYLFDNKDLLRKMRGTGWLPVKEEELLLALGRAILPSAQFGPRARDGYDDESSPFREVGNILIGVAPSIPLDSPDSSARLRKEARMAAYFNANKSNNGRDVSGTNTLKALLVGARQNPAVLRKPETSALLAREFGKKLFALLLKPDEEPNLDSSLAELGLDSLIAVEMRAWWRQVFEVDISVLEMLSMGTLEALGERIAKQLAALYEG